MKEQNENKQLLLVVLFLVIAFAWKVWSMIGSKFIHWYFSHRSLIVLVITLLAIVLALLIKSKIGLILLNQLQDAEITNGKSEDSVYAGRSKNGERIYVNLSFRRMHTQIVGTTNAGKTESVIAPWAIDDIEKGRGLILIDGKADKSLLNKLYAYAVKNNRTNDFRLFSLSDYEKSHTFNPLIGQSIDQITEKIFNSFKIENEYYRAVQFDVLKNVLTIFKEAKEIPNFIKVRQAILDPSKLKELAERSKNILSKEWATDFINTSPQQRREQISGLVSNLGYFTSGEVGALFNTSKPTIDIEQAMNEGLIVYFQLPVLKAATLGKAVAKMVLQDIQSSVSNRHASGKEDHPFFSIYLDDFTEYLTPQFVSLLNKSRSANVGVTFAHQAIGDLESLGPEIKNQIQTNSNLKIFMRTNEPDSAEYFAKIIGTKQNQKTTRRQRASVIGKEMTGDGSVRDVEEFVYHPNVFKNELGLGEAIMILPHTRGSKSVRIKFDIRKNIPTQVIPSTNKPEPELLTLSTAIQSTNSQSQGSERSSPAAHAINNQTTKEVEYE